MWHHTCTFEILQKKQFISHIWKPYVKSKFDWARYMYMNKERVWELYKSSNFFAICVNFLKLWTPEDCYAKLQKMWLLCVSVSFSHTWGFCGLHLLNYMSIKKRRSPFEICAIFCRKPKRDPRYKPICEIISIHLWSWKIRHLILIFSMPD